MTITIVGGVSKPMSVPSLKRPVHGVRVDGTKLCDGSPLLPGHLISSDPADITCKRCNPAKDKP